MTRALFLVLAIVASSGIIYGQQPGVLHIKVLLLAADGTTVPVPHHALLISEEPPTEPPRRVVVSAAGTADVTLRPGDYVIESDRPIAYQGRVYQWTKRLAVHAGDASLELNAKNAEETASPSGNSLDSDPSFLLSRWDRTVIGIWTPLAHGAGVIVDAAGGLVATNARLAGSASEFEVQLTSDIKVRARLVVADPDIEVAILQVHPSLTESIPALVPDCRAPSAAPSTPIAPGQELVTITVPLRGTKDLVIGTAVRVEAHAIASDMRVAPFSAGGPVFADGRLVGITSAASSDTEVNGRRWASRTIGVGAVCSMLASAAAKMRNGAPPAATHLPVDPARSVPADVLTPIVARRAGSLSPPQIASADFDVAFITPVHTFGAQSLPGGPTRQRSGPGLVDVGSPALRAVSDFANWSDYVADFLPVLLVRVTPKLAENFWTTVARGAAQTQGIAVPPIKRIKAGFARLRAFCGDAEVTPIHPFLLEQRLSESEAIHEGLYAFDPAALGPQCGTVKLTLYSDRQPDKGDTRQIDPKLVQDLANDFAAYRAASAP